MNKHEVILDMRKDKMLFISKRYKYNDNKVSASENLSFLSIILFIVITSFKSIVVDSDEESSDSSKDIRKRSTSTLRTFKKKMIQKSDLLNIVEINVLIYYYLARSKENKLFSLIMNEIYDTPIEPFEISSSMKRDNRISINDSCLCDFEIKYKKCYESYIPKNPQINNIKILTS